MRIKKILITCDNYYPIGGGIQQYVREFKNFLEEQRYTVIFLTGSIEGKPERELMEEGFVIRTPLMVGAIREPQLVLERWEKFVSLIRSIAPDIVYANNHASIAIIKASHKIGIPVIYCCHGWGILCPLRIRFLKAGSEDLCYNERSPTTCKKCKLAMDVNSSFRRPPFKNRVKALLGSQQKSLSRVGRLFFDLASPVPYAKIQVYKALKSLVKRYGQYQKILDSADAIVSLSQMYSGFFNPQKTRVIPHGIDTKWFIPKDGPEILKNYSIPEKYILVTSRIHHNKGQSYAVETLRYLPDDIKLVLAGNSSLFSGPKYEQNIHTEEIRQTIEQYKLKDRVIFTGFLKAEELRFLYSKAITTLVPSIWADPYAVVTIEAMSCGCPVIITRNSGSAEAVDHGVNGYIVSRKAPQDMAEAVLNTIKNRDTTGKAAREKIIVQFDWTVIGPRIIELFQEVIDSKSKVTIGFGRTTKRRKRKFHGKSRL